jgi:hypothetical protein
MTTRSLLFDPESDGFCPLPAAAALLLLLLLLLLALQAV